MRTVAIILLLVLAACEQQPGGEPVVRKALGGDPALRQADIEPTTSEADEGPPPAFASACKPATFEGTALTHCVAEPSRHDIAAALASGSLQEWRQGREGATIAFVMNGGMYDGDLKPVGYFVSESDRLAELDRAEGEGNFYLQPNGVFFGTDGRWQVLETQRFLSTITERPDFGTQSGPMLVIDGALHPEIAENGSSLAVRNGVGIDAQGTAHFVISDEPISFGRLARFFRDELGTPNALYLDGAVSSLWNPVTGRIDGGRVGPLLVVENK
ncbi:MAG: phosphodiester glycosidase family protein [Erythrobacter sp.]